MYLVVNIGCLECGVSSNIVGLFSDKIKAESVAKECQKKHGWREGGQNDYQVFALPVAEKINAEYELG